MRYQIPQFIEIEDKLFGPLTLKQFIYLAGGAGFAIVAYLLLPLSIALVVIVPVVAFALALAFYKINNKPFIFVLEAAFKYVLHPKLYIWHQETKTVNPEKKAEDAVSSAFIPKLSNSKLKDLTWSLDTKEALNPVTGPDTVSATPPPNEKQEEEKEVPQT